MDDTPDLEAWYLAARKERMEQVSEHGYTADHDDEHGVEHLILLTMEYIRTGQDIKAAATLMAIESWMKRHDYILDGHL